MVIQKEVRLEAFVESTLRLANKLPNDNIGKYYKAQIQKLAKENKKAYRKSNYAQSMEDYRESQKNVLNGINETIVNLRVLQKKEYASVAVLNDLIDNAYLLISNLVLTFNVDS